MVVPLLAINNAAKSVFKPIEEAFEPAHFGVATIGKGTTITA